MQQQLMDQLVDAWWAEPVEFHPWTRGDATSEGGPDPDRPVLIDFGAYVRPGARITGEGGTQGAQLSTQIVQQDVWCSITGDKVGDPSVYGKGDRVYWPERDEWFEVSYIQQSATNRPDFHLIRLQPSSVVRSSISGGILMGAPIIGTATLLLKSNLSAPDLVAGEPTFDEPVI